LQAGGVYAIEPFVTLHDASGRVEDAPETTIYRFVKSRQTFDVYARQLMKYIEETFHTLPFAERWLQNVVPAPYYSQAFRELLSSRVVSGYAVFVEQSGKPVAQSEHTVLVTEAGCEVLT
jgi:methionyl aminopeptidase